MLQMQSANLKEARFVSATSMDGAWTERGQGTFDDGSWHPYHTLLRYRAYSN
jgi:hypothetical protein